MQAARARPRTTSLLDLCQLQVLDPYLQADHLMVLLQTSRAFRDWVLSTAAARAWVVVFVYTVDEQLHVCSKRAATAARVLQQHPQVGLLLWCIRPRPKVLCSLDSISGIMSSALRGQLTRLTLHVSCGIVDI